MARKRVTENSVVVSTGAAAAPARRKSATSKRTSRPAVEVSTAVTEATPVEPVAQVATSLSNEDIARLAYSFWEARGYQGGSPEEDWLRAEQQLTAQYAK
jgi:hypothetical protein